ncbi:MAG TPA: Rieske 2Fe-2S domain-containing protein [Actinomycetota bacterium]|nr:Rieske 2Fe-2S domain-containing protein [Actinomycetota bacterium]
MSDEIEVCRSEDLPPGSVTGAGRWAVGNAAGERFAVTRRCRHMVADLAKGSIDADGCLVCPRHGAAYDVESGRMTRGPRGIYAKVPGLEAGLKAATKALPLGRGSVTERDGVLFVE